MPYTQEITAKLKLNVMASMQKDWINMDEMILTGYSNRRRFKNLSKHNKRSSESYMAYEKYSTVAFDYIKPKNQSISHFNKINSVLNSHKTKNKNEIFQPDNGIIFGSKETAVYMTLYDDLYYNRTLRTRSTAGTQATASINKCLQIQLESNKNEPSIQNSNSCSYYSSCTMTTLPYYESKKIDRLRYSDVYFFGRKRDSTSSEKMEMGKKGKPQRSGQTNSMPVQTNKVTGASTGTCTKTVSIKDEKTCNENTFPAIAQPAKGEMVATVSHIKLGPREPCPVHGREPCQGPKCIVASSGEEKAPVKVTTLSNPRRGVFELVIRRMTGAPLAKNELMLEWTPPPCQPSCGQPCILPCSPVVPSCYPSKCKMIVCRPSACKPKGCRKPCGPPCRTVPCSFCCKKLCGRPCRPCKPRRPCPPSPCKPCSPCRSCKPCRPCPPPRKIFKRPCPSPCCKPCGRCSACSPCGPSPPCKLPAPCRSCRRCRRCKPCPPLRCKTCKRCRPCPPSPCRSRSPSPCKPCRPSRPCRPCTSPPCRPFPPPPCRPCSPCPPCLPLCSSSPCCNSPFRGPSCATSRCLSPCAKCCKKPRKCKSHPRIRAHRKRISPCANRSKCCPVVRCRSLPGIFIGCCGLLPCPPLKCCSVKPCKPPRCKSSCSTCCA